MDNKKKNSSKVCKVCGSKQNSIYGGVCTACRSVKAIDKEQERLDLEHDIGPYGAPKTLGIEGFVDIGKRMNRRRQEGFSDEEFE